MNVFELRQRVISDYGAYVRSASRNLDEAVPVRLPGERTWPRGRLFRGAALPLISFPLPFCKAFADAFATMCEVPSSGLMGGKNQRCFAFLDDANEGPTSPTAADSKLTRYPS